MPAVTIDGATGSLRIGGKLVFPIVLSNPPPPASRRRAAATGSPRSRRPG